MTLFAGRRRLLFSLLLTLVALSLVAVGAACSSTSGPDDVRTERRTRATTPAPTRTRTPRPTATPTVDRFADRDGDGVPDIEDACPDEADFGQWTDPDNPDGCPDTIEDLLVFAADEVDYYWELVFDDAGVPYETAAEFIGYYNDLGESACGPLVPNNAFYCPYDHGIYLHVPFLQWMLDEIGDFGPAFVVAHEWGHLVQGNLGILDDPSLYSIQIELQADCFAGAWTAYSEHERGILEEGDFDEAILSLFLVGDDFDTEFFDSQAHGTPGERIDWFKRGYDQGIDVCLSLLDPGTPIGR